MSEARGSDADQEAYEIERALWFFRLFYDREPHDAVELRRVSALSKGVSAAKFLYYASQLENFHQEAAATQNVLLDSLFRKRSEYLVASHCERTAPNTFVVGQPRSATTSLHDYFADHPNVFVPTVKETNYYSHWSESCLGYAGLRYIDYLMYFMDAENEAVRCDISPFYLSEPGAALRIYRDNPRAKIIAILRDPIDLVVSKFNLDHGAGEADIDGWVMRGLTQFRENAPRWSHEPCVTTLFHCDISRGLSEYLRYFKGRTRLYLFDDVVADQEATYRDICGFLEIPFHYQRRYWSWRSQGSAKPNEAVLRELAATLRPMVQQCEAVTGLDLSRWYNGWL